MNSETNKKMIMNMKFKISKYFDHVYIGFKQLFYITSLLLTNRWLEFYRSFFDMCTIIRRRKSDPEQFRHLVQPKISALIMIAILFSIKSIYNCYWSNKKDKIWVKINADVITDANLHSNANWFMISSLIAIDLVTFLLYFKNPTVNHLKSIIIDRRDKCFHWPYRYHSMMPVDYIVDFSRKIVHYFFYLIWLLSKSKFRTIHQFMIILINF